jgi:hypothetical protein
MKNSFYQQLSDHISFGYSCFDRLVFNGHILGTYKEANIVQLLRNLNFNKLSNGVIRVLTDQLNEHIKDFADKNNIPVIWWDYIGGTNGAKKDYVLANYYKQNPGNVDRVLCILTTREFVKSSSVREFERKDKSGKYSRLYIVQKPVKQYYIYLHDKDLGLCCLKISSYLPFPCKFYCNGHYMIQRELDKQGLSYKMKDNSFTSASEVDAFLKIADNVPEGDWIVRHIERWMGLFFRFRKQERSTCSRLLYHSWFISQTEVCSNVIFKSPVFLQDMFRHILAEQHVIGYPDSLGAIFEAKRNPKKSSTKLLRIGTQACIKHWLNKNSIKMYNKSGCLLRVETTINSPGLPGRKFKKAACYLQAYYWYSFACNNRYFETISKVDPRLFSSMDLLNQTIITQSGRRIAVPDLRKDSQVELLRVLLRPKYLTFGFRTKDLVGDLEQNPKTAKIRYELSKLIARKLVKKIEGSNYYVVTKEGWNWMWLMLFQKDYLVNPLLSVTFKKEVSRIQDHDTKKATRIKELNLLLSEIRRDFRIVA